MNLFDKNYLSDESVNVPAMWNIRDEIVDRLYTDNLNYPSIMVGGPGSGKSIGALKYQDCISRDGYNPDLIIFQPRELLELLTGTGGYRLRRGDVVVFEEAGLSISNKRWYAEANVIMSQILQSFRYRNLGLFLTVPSTGYIDPSLRNQFLSRQHCIKVNHRKETGVLRFYESTHNPIFSKTYNKHRREFRNGEWVVLNHYHVNRPRRKAIREYESMKHDYLTEFYEQRLKDIKEEEGKQSIDYSKPPEIADHVDRVLDNLNEFVKTYNKQTYFDLDQVRNKCLVGEKTAKRIKSDVLNILRSQGKNNIS